MRTIILDGRLGKDAEVLTSKKGVKYVKFSIANNEYLNGEEKTTWFDVMSFDSNVIEKKINMLKKGTMVYVTGNIRTEVSVSNGKVWTNHYITASSIEKVNFGTGNNAGGAAASTTGKDNLSVYTGGTKSATVTAQVATAPEVTIPLKRAELVAETLKPQPVTEPNYNAAGAVNTLDADDDLPF